MAGHRLVDREQRHLAVVHLAQVRLGELGRPVLGHRRDREERLLAVVERPRRVEHRAAERAHELGGPVDVERLVDEPDDPVLAAERLDPHQLLAAVRDELVGGRMVGGDRVEHAADQRALVVGRRLAGPPRRPRVARDPHHLRAHRRELRLGPREDRGRRDLRVAQRVPQLVAEQRLAQRGLARRRRRDLVGRATDRTRPAPPTPRRPPRAAAAGSRRRRGRLRPPPPPSRPPAARAPATPPTRLPAISACSFDTGRGALPVTARASGEDRRDALEPPGDRQQPLGERRELARQQRMQARRRSGRPTTAGPRRPRAASVSSKRVRLELAQEEVAVDPLAARQGGVVEPGERRHPARRERESCLASGLAGVRPLVVVAVVADATSRSRDGGRTARRGRTRRGRRRRSCGLLSGRDGRRRGGSESSRPPGPDRVSRRSARSAMIGRGRRGGSRATRWPATSGGVGVKGFLITLVITSIAIVIVSYILPEFRFKNAADHIPAGDHPRADHRRREQPHQAGRRAAVVPGQRDDAGPVRRRRERPAAAPRRVRRQHLVRRPVHDRRVPGLGAVAERLRVRDHRLRSRSASSRP